MKVLCEFTSINSHGLVAIALEPLVLPLHSFIRIIYPQFVEGLVDRLVELGKQFDYMTYPNRDHGIHEGRGTSLHLRMHMVRYLLNHLPPGAR